MRRAAVRCNRSRVSAASSEPLPSMIRCSGAKLLGQGARRPASSSGVESSGLASGWGLSSSIGRFHGSSIQEIYYSSLQCWAVVGQSKQTCQDADQ